MVGDIWILKQSKPHICLRWQSQPFDVNTCKKENDLTTCTNTELICILLQTYVISQLISSLSPLTDRHMVLCSPTALAKEWICISWDLRSLLPWNEFYTSLIPDLLFTPWPNMQVGLPDAWLDRNDCSGTQQPPLTRAEESDWGRQRLWGARYVSLSAPLTPPHPRARTHARLLQLFTLEMSHSKCWANPLGLKKKPQKNKRAMKL